MSQNVDLLSQIEADFQSLKTTPPLASQAKDRSDNTGRNRFDRELLRLAHAVFLVEDAQAPREVVICGVEQENGSSRICFELARLLAFCSNKPVCLVDGDIRSHPLSKMLDYASFAATPTTAHGICVPGEPNLWCSVTNVLDPVNQGVLAPPSQLRQALSDLRKAFEFVLIDAPGLNSHSDALALGRLADATILIIEANATRKTSALKAKKALAAANVRLLGTILNNRTYPIPDKIYRAL
jgi:polysaccharide biosynthesis transport protein